MVKKQIDKARSTRIEALLAARSVSNLKKVGAELIGPCPKCGGDDRFGINLKEQVWNCRQCEKGGDVIALVQHLDNIEFVPAVELLSGEKAKPNGKDRAAVREYITAAFDYHNESGDVVYTIDRVEYRNRDGTPVLKDGRPKKRFQAKRADPSKPDSLIYNIDGIERVLYRLPEVIEGIANGHPVLVPEGEGKVERARGLGLIATCNAFGSGVKDVSEYAKYMRDADVVLLPDNDTPGFQHINKIGAALIGVANSIRVLLLPGLPRKGDVIDWLDAGGTREQLDELIADAPAWQPLPEAKAEACEAEKAKAEAGEDQIIAALAKKKGIEYGRQRKKVANDLGITAGDLDREVRAYRKRERELVPLFSHWETIISPGGRRWRCAIARHHQSHPAICCLHD
jgi:DNA primase